MLSLPEVMDILGVSRQVVRELIDSGALPASKIGQQFRLWPADVKTYVEGQRVRPRRM